MVKNFATILLCTIGLSCDHRDQLSAQDMMDVSDQFHAKLELAMPAKDIKSILDLYEDDAMYLPLSGPVLRGVENIRKGYEKTFSNNVTSFKMERLELSGDDQFLIEVGIINATFQRDTLTIPGSFKYQNTYRRQPEGGYKIHRGIYNMNN